VLDAVNGLTFLQLKNLRSMLQGEFRMVAGSLAHISFCLVGPIFISNHFNFKSDYNFIRATLTVDLGIDVIWYI
jgi:hypothetical protein